jgi:alkanesulfonate monooxygenase SsuD/methylene tetrahydromethanopterin reductase-like flavin-dependent oxidoreductase (luciferase family)
MKFGMMYEIQIPEPHYPGIVQDTYKQVMAQVVLAEEMGFEHFWTVEHHFLTEFSYCPAPEVLYGAISQRTSKIRIGHAVALLPPQYNHPIRVAERAAVLDILSDGRAELGTGRSTTLIEMGGFGINPGDTKAMWEEAVAMIPRMWMEDPFSHEGRFFKVPPRSIIPKPVQKPHPPMWVACAQPDSFTAAGKKGLGALCFNIGVPEELTRRVEMYREGIRQAEPVGAFVNNQVAALGVIHCAETDKQAKDIGGPGGMWFLNKSLQLYRPWQEQGVKVPDSYKFALNAISGERTGKTVDDFIEGGMFCMGNPDTCIRVLKKYEAAGVDQVLCFMQCGSIPHQNIMDSIRLFGKYVIPYFRPQ